jgi:hypothetical protein
MRLGFGRYVPAKSASAVEQARKQSVIHSLGRSLILWIIRVRVRRAREDGCWTRLLRSCWLWLHLFGKAVEELESLEIRYARCFRMPGTGLVYMTPEGVGSFVDSTGNALPQWIEEFLCDPKQEDVLSKLRHTSAQERWVFVPVTFGGAPWSVESYLTGDLDRLPATEPNLPSPVTAIWVASTFGTHGVRWDSAGWRSFRISEESK